MSFRAICVSLVCLLFGQGCKIEQWAGHGGSIVSMSGAHDCPEGQICVVDVSAGEPFREVFTAVPRQGYAFAGWGNSEHGICSGKNVPCLVDIPGSLTGTGGTLFLTAEFYHRPVLVESGTLSMEYTVWEQDVRYDSMDRLPDSTNGSFFLFAGDFDGDADDDVLIAGAIYPSDPPPTVAPQQGVILLNNGDFTFTVAKGDRPSSIHPREVLLADFNRDGRNDFFIADHGYDAAPISRLEQPVAAMDK